jgi:tRNA dimethylallyltransferase
LIHYDVLVITGTTASGKTGLAARMAFLTGGEVISADSRQVYRRMTIGTGKDYEEFTVEGKKIPYHLIDIADPGYKYNVFEYQRDFLTVYNDLKSRSIFPVVCGGSGLYVDSIISGYRLVEVPPDEALRSELSQKSLQELTEILNSFKRLHNKTDTDSCKRAIRAIEIERYYSRLAPETLNFPALRSLVVAPLLSRESRRNAISTRLRKRLNSGMIEEVQSLLDSGLTPDELIYYGLEYKFITLYLTGKMTRDEMFTSLETAIHQFAKRQMTWFRGMERRGIRINWIDASLDTGEKERIILELLEKTQ